MQLIVIVFRFSQLKAPSQIFTTSCGISIDVSPEQPLKAALPITLISLGIVVLTQPNIRESLAVQIIALQSFLESYTGLLLSTIILTRAGVSPNAHVIFSTLAGIFREVNPTQPLKELFPIASIPLSIVVFLQPHINVFVAVSMIALQLFLESYRVLPSLTTIRSSDGQFAQMLFP